MFLTLEKIDHPEVGVIIFNEKRFRATDPGICVPDEVEAVWSVFTPITGCTQQLKVNG